MGIKKHTHCNLKENLKIENGKKRELKIMKPNVHR